MRLARVTQIESFRKWITGGEDDWMTEQMVIDSVTGSFAGNDKTRIGTAFHSCVETDMSAALELARRIGAKDFAVDVPDEQDEEKVYKVRLALEHVELACRYRASMPQAAHEIRLYGVFGDIAVTGQADVLWGNEIHDIKTKYGSARDGATAEYTDSFQWRAYCQLFEADKFVFDLFRFRSYTDRMGMNVSGITLEREEPITCYRYERMEEDNAYLVRSFYDWIKFRKLDTFLKEYERDI